MTSREIASRMVAGGTVRGAGGKPAQVGAALQRMIVRVSETLRDSMGEDGRNALLVRALARSEADHPALKKIVVLDDHGIQLDGVGASIEAHGVKTVTAAIEAFLAALIDVLGRLIGEEMAMQMIDQDNPQPPMGGGAKAP